MATDTVNTTFPTPIAQLGPEHNGAKAARGVVTIVWPYNSVKNTIAFILAEPEFRLRRPKGQIRVNFTGSSARAVTESGLGSSVEVLLSLEGVEWVVDETKSHDWQLKFCERLVMEVKDGESGDTRNINVDHPHLTEVIAEQEAEPPADTEPFVLSPITNLPLPTPVKNNLITKLDEDEYESPAFIKRARVSYGSLFDGGLDIFEDDGGVKGAGRKRSRFGRHSGAWRYTSQSSSPEPEVSQHDESGSEVERENDKEQEPEQEQARSSPRPKMTDEGCQTMELYVPPIPIPSVRELHREPQSRQPIQDMNPFAPNGVLDHDHREFPVNGWPEATPVSNQACTATGTFTSDQTATPVSNPADTSTGMFAHSQAVPFSSGPEFEMADSQFQRGWNSPPSVKDQSTVYPNLPDDVLRNDPFPHDNNVPEPYSLPKTNLPIPADPINVPANPFARAMSQEPPAMDPPSPFAPANAESRQPLASGATSWNTINDRSRSASKPLPDRLSSIEGQTPESALVIGESDFEDELEGQEAAAAAALERSGAFIHGPEGGMVQYDDADDHEPLDEVEDEVDARYANENESGYDDEEQAGDYDARNYLAPADDEDDSHDEDLRPRRLEPEFQDEQEGESWDDEEGYDDQEDEEYDSEYEVENMAPQHARAPPSRPAAPIVIDLLSSSEDEGDEDQENQAPPQPKRRSVLNSRQGAIATDSIPGSPQYGPGSVAEDTLESDEHSQPQNLDIELEEFSGEEMGDHASEYQGSEAEGLHDEDASMRNESEGVVSDEALEGVELVETRLRSQSARSKSRSKSPAVLPSITASNDVGQDEIMQDVEHERSSAVPQELPSAREHESTGSVIADEENRQTNIQNDKPEYIPVEELEAETLALASDPQIQLEDQPAISDTQEQLEDQVMESVAVAPSSRPLTQPSQIHTCISQQAVVIQETAISLEIEVPVDQFLTPLGTQPKEPEFFQESASITVMDVDELEEANATSTEGSQPQAAAPSIMIRDSMEVVTEETFQHLRASPASRLATRDDAGVSQKSEELFESNPSFQSQANLELNDAGTPQRLEVPADEPGTSFQSQVNVEDGDLESEKPIGEDASFVSQLDADDALQAALMGGDLRYTQGNLPESSLHGDDDEIKVSQKEQVAVVLDDDVDISQYEKVDVSQSDGVIASREEKVTASQKAKATVSQAEEVAVVLNDDVNFSKYEKVDVAPSEEENITQSEEADIKNEEVVFVHKQKDDTSRNENIDITNEEDDILPNEGVDMNTEVVVFTHRKNSPVSEPAAQEIPLAQVLSPILGSTPRKERRNDEEVEVVVAIPEQATQVNDESESDEDVTDVSASMDPSIQLGRTSPIPKRGKNRREATPEITTRPHTRSQKSQTPDIDESVQLAKDTPSKLASKASSKTALMTPSKAHFIMVEAPPSSPATSTAAEEGKSIADSRVKLSRHLAKELPEYTSLKVFRQHPNKSVDVMAVAMMTPPEPRRARGGPREYMMSFTITDYSIAPKVIEVQLYRPHKESLPRVKAGDIVLLRDFLIVSMMDKDFGLRTKDTSSWAVFDKGPEELAQIKGAPVEYGRNEEVYAVALKQWLELLDAKTRQQLEVANQNMVKTGKAK